MHAEVGEALTDVGAPAGGTGRLLLERDAELATLRTAVDAAGNRAGAVVIIQGPPGAGKTSLLDAAAVYARSSGVRVLSGRGREMERAVALGLAVDLLAPPVLAAPHQEQTRLLAGRAAPAGPVLFDPGAEPQTPADTVLLALCLVAAHLAGWNGAGKPSPLLLAADDVQWADVPSLRFLAMLADQADRLPLSLVLAMREGEESSVYEAGWPDGDVASLRRLSGHQSATLLFPAPLTTEAVGRLASARFPGAGAELIAAVTHASGGNPFFVAELLHSLGPAGDTQARGSQAAAGEPPPAALVANLVPSAVLRSVIARLARLPGDAVRLAASLAVLGDDTPLRRVAAHAELTVAAAERAADLLAGARLLRSSSPLAFTHPLTGAAVYADLPGFQRARAHRRAADLLAAEGESTEKVAGHLLAASPEGNAGTVTVLTSAARRALHGGDPGAAVRLFRRALEEPPPPELRAGLLTELAEAQATGGEATAHVSLTKALSLLDPAQVHARSDVLSVLARIYHARGDLARAAEASSQALDLLDPRDPAWEGALADFMSIATFYPPLVADGQRRIAPVLRDARRGKPPLSPCLTSHVTLRLALAGESPAAVRALAERALAADPLVEPTDHGTLFGLVAHALVIAGECAAVELAADAALEAARRRGDFLAHSSGCFHRALSRFRRGALTAALADLETAQASPEAGWRGAIGWIGALDAEINVDRGDHAAARESLRLAGPRPADSMDAALLGHARARLALAEHDPAVALSAASDAGQLLAQTFGFDHAGLLPWRTTAALAAHYLGDHEQASRLTAAALDRARDTGVAADVGAALRVTGLVARPGPDIAVLAEAAAMLARTPAALEHARALADLGSALRRVGRRTASLPPLRESLALAEHLHARPLAERVREELHTAGVRPRRAAVTGIDALTPAERRVALLALNGYANAAIAQTLFVTTKTVETHLSRAYRKLGVAGRRELRQVYGPH
jgi:DNA-binding CsgD family transcriptional regulator